MMIKTVDAIGCPPDQVRQIIINRDWYTDPFDLSASLARLAVKLSQVSGQEVKSAMLEELAHQVFSDRLTRVRGVPLPEHLNRLGCPWLVWTQGEPAWQEFKAKDSGLFNYLDPRLFLVFDQAKPAGLVAHPVLRHTLQSQPVDLVIAVDDKPTQLDDLRDLWSTQSVLTGYPLITFTFDPNNPATSGQKLIDRLSNQAVPPGKTLLLMDLDNVLIPTYKILASEFVDRVIRLLS